MKKANVSDIGIWTLKHQIRKLGVGKRLRLVVGAATTVTWSASASVIGGTIEAEMLAPDLGFVDLPTQFMTSGARVSFALSTRDEYAKDAREYVVTTCEPA